MRKIVLILVGLVITLAPSVVYAEEVTDDVKATVVENCLTIKENLGAVQRKDARTRVYLGRYYETILVDFVTPLNVRLVENNLSGTELIENQNNLVAGRAKFMNDYIAYQQGLEELVLMDCRAEPEKFYEQLVTVREKRARVQRDTKRMREWIGEQVELVKGLKTDFVKNTEGTK